MKHGNVMGADGIPVKVWKSLGEEGVDNFFYYVVRSITGDVRAGETTRGMETCTVLSYQSSQRWGHPGLVEL